MEEGEAPSRHSPIRLTKPPSPLQEAEPLRQRRKPHVRQEGRMTLVVYIRAPQPARNPEDLMGSQVMKVEREKALLTFSCDVDVPIKNPYNITEGALPHELHAALNQ